ncbi:MAG: hypothetical protein MZV63_70605 [Marinilabiliales bacterium]|nr:hypothetical protein [Marinilabiliales bacterium]
MTHARKRYGHNPGRSSAMIPSSTLPRATAPTIFTVSPATIRCHVSPDRASGYPVSPYPVSEMLFSDYTAGGFIIAAEHTGATAGSAGSGNEGRHSSRGTHAVSRSR